MSKPIEFKKNRKGAKKVEKMLNAPLDEKISEKINEIVKQYEDALFVKGSGNFTTRDAITDPNDPNGWRVSGQAISGAVGSIGGAIGGSVGGNWGNANIQCGDGNSLSFDGTQKAIDEASPALDLATLLKEYQSFEDMVQEVEESDC